MQGGILKLAEAEAAGLPVVWEQTQRGVWVLVRHRILNDTTASLDSLQCPLRRLDCVILAYPQQRDRQAEEPPGQMLRYYHLPLSRFRYCFEVDWRLRPEARAAQDHREVSP